MEDLEGMDQEYEARVKQEQEAVIAYLRSGKLKPRKTYKVTNDMPDDEMVAKMLHSENVELLRRKDIEWTREHAIQSVDTIYQGSAAASFDSAFGSLPKESTLSETAGVR